MKVYESLAFAHALRCGKVLFSKEEVQILESSIRDDAAIIADLRARLAEAERELESVDRALDFAHSSRTRRDNGEEIQRSRTDRIDGMGQAGGLLEIDDRPPSG